MSDKIIVETDLFMALYDKSARLDAIERFINGVKYPSIDDVIAIGGLEIEVKNEPGRAEEMQA